MWVHQAVGRCSSEMCLEIDNSDNFFDFSIFFEKEGRKTIFSTTLSTLHALERNIVYEESKNRSATQDCSSRFTSKPRENIFVHLFGSGGIPFDICSVHFQQLHICNIDNCHIFHEYHPGYFLQFHLNLIDGFIAIEIVKILLKQLFFTHFGCDFIQIDLTQ